MENLGRCVVTKGAQDAWAGTGFACPLPGAKGWWVGVRTEDTADSKPLLTPGLTVSSRSPEHIKEIKTMGSFPHFDCSLVWNLSVSWHLEFWLTPLPGVPVGLPQHVCGPLCEPCWAAFSIWGTQDPSPNLLQLCLCKAEVIRPGIEGRPGLLCLCFIQMAGTVTHQASLFKPGHRPGVVVLIIDTDLKNTLTSFLKHPPAPQNWALMGKGWLRGW